MEGATGPRRNRALDDDRTRTEYAALVRHAATGDRDAVERLLMRAQEVAYRFSLLVCGHQEDAEDVMQDALLNTYRYVSRITDPEAFRTWLYTTVRNACLMKRRRHAGEPAHLVSLDHGLPSAEGTATPVDVADAARPVDQVLIDQGMADRLLDALKKLPSSYRMIVVMREMEGLSTREVATITGISEANVKTRLHRARLMLREQVSSPPLPDAVRERARTSARRLLGDGTRGTNHASKRSGRRTSSTPVDQL